VAFAGSRKNVSVNGIEAEYLEAGSGEPLLFLHSSWAPDAYCTRYLDELSKTYRVIAPYHPGYGHHPKPKHFRDISDVAYFYLDLLEEAELDDVTLVGASIGGWIASEIAVRSTERLSRLVLVSPFGIKVGDHEARDFADFWAVEEPERAALEFQKPEFRTVEYFKKTDDELTAIARGREAEAFYGWKPFMHNPQLKHWLHRINIPTLVITGKDDRLVRRENSLAYLNLIPGAKLETVNDAGHHPHIEQPLAVSRTISAFASKH
jgi:pimeloyl-ACP methyl ester carboxylesterase